MCWKWGMECSFNIHYSLCALMRCYTDLISFWSTLTRVCLRDSKCWPLFQRVNFWCIGYHIVTWCGSVDLYWFAFYVYYMGIWNASANRNLIWVFIYCIVMILNSTTAMILSQPLVSGKIKRLAKGVTNTIETQIIWGWWLESGLVWVWILQLFQ